MKAVTNVLVKSQDMPEPTFDATLEYVGIEVTLRVAALVHDGELIKVEKINRQLKIQQNLIPHIKFCEVHS